MRSLITFIHNKDSNNVSLYMKKLKMRGFILKEDSNVIYFAGLSRSIMAVNFFWRLGSVKIPGSPSTFGNSVDPIIIEAPHEGTDNTLPLATTIFMNCKARALISNGVHNKAGPKGVKCHENSSKSDGAHNTGTMFHKVHSAMENLYPYACFPQIHGMKGGKNFNILVVNGFNSRFDGPSKSAPLLFGQAVAEVFKNEKRLRTFSFCGNIPGVLKIKTKKGFVNKPLREIYRRPKGCHNTTVTGHQLNGGDQCSVGKRDTGRFIHIEYGPRFRLKSRGNMKNKMGMAKAFSILGEKWILTETNYAIIEK